MLFWGLDNALVTYSTCSRCSLSLTHLSPQEPDLQGIYHHEFSLFSQSTWFLPEKDVQKLQRQDLPWLSSLLSSCVPVFPKLNCRWEHVVIHSIEPSMLWLNFQAIWTHPGSSVGLALFCDKSSHSYDVNKSKSQHMWLQHWWKLYSSGIACWGYTYIYQKKKS